MLLSGIAIAWIAAPNPAQSQALTLDMVLEKAVAHNYDLKNQMVKEAIADNELEKLKAARQPKITLDGDLRVNPLLQTSIIPGAAFTPPGQPVVDDREVKFGTLFNAGFGLNASYALWDPTYETSSAILQEQRRAETTTLQQQTIDVKLLAAEAFYAVLLQQEQEALATSRLQRAQDLRNVAQQRFEYGTALAIDVQKSELDVQTARATLTQTTNNLKRNRLQLARLIGLSAGELPTLAPLAINTSPSEIESPVPAASLAANRLEVKAEQHLLSINRQQQTLESKKYLPRVDLYGNISLQHLSDDFAVWERWFPFAYMGLRASFTLYDGRLKARNSENYRLRSIINQQNLSRIQEDLTYEIESASLDLSNALSQYEAAQLTLRNARDVAAVDRVQYEEGKLLFSERRNTEFALREAESQLLGSLQQYLIAELRKRKAEGKF
ncbi:MAG: TolC family protein [Saprospiraceae bacterium]|nr:TolC family protein [Saprospiraceae bacterium]